VRAPAGQRALLATGLAVAYAAFGLTFRGPKERFWPRMTRTGLALGSLALLADARRDPARGPYGRIQRSAGVLPDVRGRDVALGLASAAGLWAVFQAGDHLTRRFLRGGEGQIEGIYALRELRPRAELAARLGLIIGPAEELFWRGFVLRRLVAALGAKRGVAAAAAAYGGAHLVTGNVTLIGSASVAGLYWSALAAAGLPMPALVVSHAAWDIWMFLLR
jgi:membrane protease YdiL (CAAX protease family)